jgi:toxin ParE1/3/4
LLRIVIRPRAASDLEITSDYYLQVASHEVAERFINEFQCACDLIFKHPDIGSRRFSHLLPGSNLRCWSFDRFPFRIFYLVKSDTLEIVAVEHERKSTANKYHG